MTDDKTTSEAKQKLAAQRIHATSLCYQRVFEESEDGYKILIDLMRHFNMLQPTFSGENPMDMAFKEGGRNVILYILKKCNMDMKSLELFIGEAEKNA